MQGLGWEYVSSRVELPCFADKFLRLSLCCVCDAAVSRGCVAILRNQSWSSTASHGFVKPGGRHSNARFGARRVLRSQLGQGRTWSPSSRSRAQSTCTFRPPSSVNRINSETRFACGSTPSPSARTTPFSARAWENCGSIYRSAGRGGAARMFVSKQVLVSYTTGRARSSGGEKTLVAGSAYAYICVPAACHPLPPPMIGLSLRRHHITHHPQGIDPSRRRVAARQQRTVSCKPGSNGRPRTERANVCCWGAGEGVG